MRVSPFRLFFKYLKPFSNQVFILFLLLIITIAIDLINPFIIARFIDMTDDGEATNQLINIAILFISISIGKQILVILSTYVSQNVGWLTTNALREDLVHHCLKLDMSFHKAKKSGELIERLDGDVNALFNFFSNLFLKLVNNIALLIGVLIILFTVNWMVGVSLTIFCLIAIIVLWISQKKAVPKWVKDREASAKYFGFLGEQITATEDIKSSGATTYVMHRFFEMINEWLPISVKAVMRYGYMWSTTLFIFGIGYAVAFSLSGYLYTNNFISIGLVYLIIKYTDLLRQPIEQIRTQLQDLQKAGASVVRIQEMFNITTNITNGNYKIETIGPVSVTFNEISFKYEEGDDVLSEVNFELKPGKILGLLGRTGSGKTTLARLIVRFYDPYNGVIKLGNQDIKELKLSELRKNIAYVTQDVQLFQATVRDNLTFFNPNISDDSIINAIHTMGVSEWFYQLPNGLDTMLDSHGTGLSSGEAQLLSFIRVFLKDPKLIILDEASSRVDPITEKLIESAINKLLVNRTCIIIAHRLLTVQRADDIMIMENGKIIEYGERVDLAHKKDSKFYHLLKVGIEEVLV